MCLSTCLSDIIFTCGHVRGHYFYLWTCPRTLFAPKFLHFYRVHSDMKNACMPSCLHANIPTCKYHILQNNVSTNGCTHGDFWKTRQSFCMEADIVFTRGHVRGLYLRPQTCPHATTFHKFLGTQSRQLCTMHVSHCACKHNMNACLHPNF